MLLRSRRRVRDERGETLVELIVAVAVLGIAAVAILGGMMLSVKSSDVGRKYATSGAYVRSFAEAIQNSIDDSGGYKSCGTAQAAYAGVAVPNLPAGYTKTVVSVQSWTGTAWGSCTADGIQRVNLRVTSPGDVAHTAVETLTVVLRQPCNGSAAVQGDDPCA